MIFRIYNFLNVDSTNDKAINFINNRNINNGFINTFNQKKGRGTYGKKWLSKKDNLLSTIFFPLKKNYPSFDEFYFINPIIIYDIIREYCKNCELTFKWPNDILINNKKCCGILQETIKKNNHNYLIVGIGINLFSNPKIDKIKTGNIFDETEIKINKNELIKKIIYSYHKLFLNLSSYNKNYYKKKMNFITNKL